MYHGHYASPNSQPRTAAKIKFFRRFQAPVLLLLCLGAVSTASYAQNSDVERFIEWRQRLAQGQHEAWKEYIGDLQGKPLFPYLQYMQLTAELSDWPSEKLAESATYARTRAFLEVWPEMHISDNLKRQWLRRLGKEKEWKLLLAQEVTSPPTDIQCVRLQGLYETQTSKDSRNAALDQAKRIWLKGSSQSKRCDGLFELLNQEKRITHADYRQRIRTALKQNNISFARWLHKQLPSAERKPVQSWFDLHSNPAELENLLQKKATPARRELAAKAMHWLAGSQPELASQLWDDFVAFVKPSESTRHKLWRRLALKAARSFHPHAEKWLAKADLKADDSYGWGWRMRAAVAAEDWKSLAKFSQIPLKLDRKARFGIAYWGAIATEKLGQPAAAKEMMQKLALQRHWYGFLAADKLGLAYSQSDPLPKSDSVNRSLLLSYPETRRARDLFLADVDWLARGEWTSLLKKLPKNLRQEAALLAYELDWPSMSARTQAVYTKTNPDETLFPMPWQPIVLNASIEHAVEPAHIWSQMRAESLYMRDVRSSAGAIGLMQLMPATARSVGKSLQLKNWRKLPLQDPATNIQLGSRYISEMLEKFDHHIPLAAAAYNAGPHRVEKWVTDRPYKDPILWVEMIPFQETRGYVQRAMYFHSMYDRRLNGQASRITELLYKELPSQMAQLDRKAEGL